MSLIEVMKVLLAVFITILAVLFITAFIVIIWCCIVQGLITILVYFKLPPAILELSIGVLFIAIISTIISKARTFH